jgi:flagellar hook-associated protein 3 FlgL
MVEGTIQAGGEVSLSQEPMVVRVDYRGAGASRHTEISEGDMAALDITGGEAFWAERMQIFSSLDGTSYRAPEAGSIFIDGNEIPVFAGDTLPAIAAKINESPAPVKASIDPETRGLTLEGTTAHQIRIEDGEGSRVLQDLGLLAPGSDPATPSWAASARVSGGSMFDMVIRLRDALYRGDQEFAGTQGLSGLDMAMTNLQSRQAEMGSRYERSEMTWNRLNEEIPLVSAALSREIGLDMVSAAVDLSRLDFAHKAALQTAAKVVQPTLLDFLR